MAIDNILHITPSYKPAYVYGGPTRSVSELCEKQALLNCYVTVYTTTANGKEDFLESTEKMSGVQVHYFKRITGDHSHFSPKLLSQVWSNCHKFDIVHIHSWWNFVAILALLICRIQSVKVVFSPRGMLGPYTFKSISKRIFHRLLGRTILKDTILHASSQKEAQEALMLIPFWDCFVLPNILDLPNNLDKVIKNSSSIDCFNLIFLARIHPVKGLDILLEALAKVTFSWRLVIVGGGEQTYISTLKSFVNKCGIGHSIDWIGWKSGEEKYRLLSKADLFILPSNYESFSNASLEALSVGTPVMISDQVGLSDYVQAQGLGWVVPLEKNCWIKALDEAWEARQRRDDIRAKAPALILQDFGAESLAKKYIEAYQKFCSK